MALSGTRECPGLPTRQLAVQDPSRVSGKVAAMGQLMTGPSSEFRERAFQVMREMLSPASSHSSKANLGPARRRQASGTDDVGQDLKVRALGCHVDHICHV